MNTKNEMVKQETQPTEAIRKSQVVTPEVDIYENADEILLVADLPGVDKESLNINLDNNTLTLEGMRRLERSGKVVGEFDYRRVFSVPNIIKADSINAELSDGVLTLHLPKADEVKPRQIPVTSA